MGMGIISFLCATADLYLKDAVVSQFRLPFSLKETKQSQTKTPILIQPVLADCDFWTADLF